MKELTALRAMLDYDLYIKYSPVLLKLDNLQREQKQVLRAIGEYYKTYKDIQLIGLDELETYYDHLYPTAKSVITENLFEKLRTIQLDNQVLLIDILNQVAERHICGKIMEVTNNVICDQQTHGIEAIEDLIEQYKDLAGSVDDIEESVCNTSVKDILRKREEAGQLKWSLSFLNDVLGSPLPKRLGHIFARPDGGKTSMAVHQMCVFAYQLKDTEGNLLYLQNEEDDEQIRLRSVQTMCNVEEDTIRKDPDYYEEMYNKKGGQRIKIIGGVDNLWKVKRYVRSFRPKVVFVDQGPKVQLPDKDLNDVRRLQMLYNNYRELAKEYECAVITLGQADQLSTNKKFLGLHNLDSSKVGIPGELDWCFGIGHVDDPGQESYRYLNIAKNKLTGKRGRATVLFNYKIGRFEQC